MDEWIVEFHDELRLPLLVDGGGNASDLLDRLIAALDERGVLSRYSLGTDPVDWWTTHPRRLWRLVDTNALWRVRAPNGEAKLIVARSRDDVLLLAAPGTLYEPLEPDQLLGEYGLFSKSEPYGRADWALSEAGAGPIDLGDRQPLDFDATFRKLPERALFDLGFALNPLPGDRLLARLRHVYDLQEDLLDRPLPRRDPIASGELFALWSQAPHPSARSTVLLLMSIDDRSTQRLIPHLERAADAAGFDLVTMFARSRWSRDGVDRAALSAQVERAFAHASGRVAGLAVHYGIAFASSVPQYRAVLGDFRARHPEVPLATEALLGRRGGELHGVKFDQPPELDPILECLGF